MTKTIGKQVSAKVGAAKARWQKTLQKVTRQKIRDFGIFKVVQRKERNRRNPRTGEEITIAAHKKAIFKQGKAVKEKVNVL